MQGKFKKFYQILQENGVAALKPMGYENIKYVQLQIFWSFVWFGVIWQFTKES